MSGEFSVQRAQLTVRPNAPVELGVVEEAQFSGGDEARIRLQRISSTLRAYRASIKELLAGKYSALDGVAPLHLTDACCMMAFVFSDGILIRYDIKEKPDQTGFIGVPEDGSLALMAPQLSGSLVHCPLDAANFDPGDKVVTITLSKCPVGSNDSSEICKIRAYVVAHRGKAVETSKLPLPLVSVLNDFTVRLAGEMLSNPQRPQRFVLESKLRLPLGWQAIEIYPPFVPEVWDPELASLWAERDLLAAVARRNLGAEHWRNVDPNAEARRQKTQLLDSFAKLLEGPEEPLHQFIKDSPQLICPAYARVWSKLRLGGRVTDLVFREPGGDYILVELENAFLPLFRKDGQQSAELTHAIDQITDWRRYLEDNLIYAQRELGLDGISSSPRCMIVIGRSATLTQENRRKLVTMENDRPRLKILTYDDLLAGARTTFENLLGPLWDPGPNAQVYFLPAL